MEAINYSTRQSRRFALDHTDHTLAALYAKLVLDFQGQNGLESYPSLSHQQDAQDGDDGDLLQEPRSRSRMDEEGHALAMVAVNMSDSVRRSVKGQGTAVLVVSDARIGGHSHIDSDDPEEIAVPPSRFAFPLPPSFSIEQHNDLLILSNCAKGRRANKTHSPPSSYSRHASPKHSTPQQQPQSHLHQQPKPLHRSPARMATVAPTVGSTFASPLPVRDRAILFPITSDVSEVDGFAEGEVLDTEQSDAWNQQHPYSYPKAQFRLATRCSSSTLYDESRPPSRSQKSKEDQPPMKQTQEQTIDDACVNSPNWRMGGRSSRGNNHNNGDSGVVSTEGSSSTPTTPLTPTPAGRDKTTENLEIFNRIPRWSNETLHHDFLAAANNMVSLV